MMYGLYELDEYGEAVNAFAFESEECRQKFRADNPDTQFAAEDFPEVPDMLATDHVCDNCGVRLA